MREINQMDTRIVTGLVPKSTTSSVILNELERYGVVMSFYEVFNIFVATYEDPRDAEDAKQEMLLLYTPMVFRGNENPLSPSEEVSTFAHLSDEDVSDEMGRFGRILKVLSLPDKRIVLYEDPRDAEDSSTSYGIHREGNEVYLPPRAHQGEHLS